MKIFTGVLRKKDNIFTYLNSKDEDKYKIFKELVPEGTLVETYMEVVSDDGSLAQLAKIHAMIKQLCTHTGDTFEDMKLIVKKKSGLCIEKELDGSKFLYCKSLANASKQDLSLVIETIQQISQILEYPLF